MILPFFYMMNKTLLILLVKIASVSACFDKQILQLSAGNYVLSPANYSYNKEIIIEAWGGGGAGNACNGYGGSSGGFIRAIISTGYKDINITVGTGGGGKNTSCQYNMNNGTYQVDYPNYGADTVINTVYSTLISTGGKWNKTKPLASINKIDGNASIITNIPSVFEPTQIPSQYNSAPSGMGSSCQYCPSNNVYTCHAGGGSNGGKPCLVLFNSINGWCSTSRNYLGTDGLTPGGGGGGNGYLPPLDANNRPINYPLCSGCDQSYGAKGGDGMVIVYYNKII